MSARSVKGKELFVSGYTCSQSVILAFGDITGLEDATAAKLSSGFGGGMGGLRSVCGAVTGMFMVANMVYGFETPDNQQHKVALYEHIRALADDFTAKHGSLICKELLAYLPGKLSQTPSLRDDAYYKARPCALLVEDAILIMEEFMEQHPREEWA